MGTINDQLKRHIEELIRSIESSVGGKVGYLTEDENGTFVITYTGNNRMGDNQVNDKGTTGAYQFLNKLKAGGLIKEEDIPKIDHNKVHGDINLCPIGSNKELTINFSDDSTQIFFSPDTQKERVFHGLKGAIESANNDPKYKIFVQEYRKLDPIINSSPEIEGIFSYFRRKFKSEFNKDVEVTHSKNNETNKMDSTFVISFDNKTGKEFEKIEQITKELGRVFGEQNITKIPINVNNTKVGFSISGNPIVLLNYIRIKDPDNLPKITQSNLAR